MKRFGSQELVTYDGESFHIRNATVYDRPSDPVPLYVAASGQVAAKLAGRVADGFICTSGKVMELYEKTLLPAVAEGAAAAGRDGGAIERMIEMKVSYDSDRARALADTRIWAALALPAEDKMGVEDPREMERRAAGVAEQAHRRWLVSDDPEEHLEQLRPYVELGFNHLVFHAPGDDQIAFIKRYGKDLLPRIRSQWS